MTFDFYFSMATAWNTEGEKTVMHWNLEPRAETAQQFMHDIGIFYPNSPFNVPLSRLWIVPGRCTATDGAAVGFCWWFILMDLTPIPPFLFLLPIFLPPCSSHCSLSISSLRNTQETDGPTLNFTPFSFSRLLKQCVWRGGVSEQVGKQALCVCVVGGGGCRREKMGISSSAYVEHECVLACCVLCMSVCGCVFVWAHEGTGVRLAGRGMRGVNEGLSALHDWLVKSMLLPWASLTSVRHSCSSNNRDRCRLPHACRYFWKHSTPIFYSTSV